MLVRLNAFDGPYVNGLAPHFERKNISRLNLGHYSTVLDLHRFWQLANGLELHVVVSYDSPKSTFQVLIYYGTCNFHIASTTTFSVQWPESGKDNMKLLRAETGEGCSNCCWFLEMSELSERPIVRRFLGIIFHSSYNSDFRTTRTFKELGRSVFCALDSSLFTQIIQHSRT